MYEAILKCQWRDRLRVLTACQLLIPGKVVRIITPEHRVRLRWPFERVFDEAKVHIREIIYMHPGLNVLTAAYDEALVYLAHGEHCVGYHSSNGALRRWADSVDPGWGDDGNVHFMSE